jgi:hypothetical protein
MVDAVAKVTGVPEKLGNLPAGTSAVSLGDSRVASESLDLLGRCVRDGGCTTTVTASASLPLMLHTINGPWLNAKITHADGQLHTLLREKHADAEIVTTLYLLALSRPPTADELAHWQKQIVNAGANQRIQAMEDFFWALLNSAEFCCNH